MLTSLEPDLAILQNGDFHLGFSLDFTLLSNENTSEKNRKEILRQRFVQPTSLKTQS